MSLLYETNALFMKGVTNQWEIQNAVAINLTFYLIRKRKILYKSLASVGLTLC